MQIFMFIMRWIFFCFVCKFVLYFSKTFERITKDKKLARIIQPGVEMIWPLQLKIDWDIFVLPSNVYKLNSNMCLSQMKILHWNQLQKVYVITLFFWLSMFLEKNMQSKSGSTKGQIMSECIYGIINFPKYHRKIW